MFGYEILCASCNISFCSLLYWLNCCTLSHIIDSMCSSLPIVFPIWDFHTKSYPSYFGLMLFCYSQLFLSYYLFLLINCSILFSTNDIRAIFSPKKWYQSNFLIKLNYKGNDLWAQVDRVRCICAISTSSFDALMVLMWTSFFLPEDSNKVILF